MKLCNTVTTTCLLRVAGYQSSYQDYCDRRITFSCPANWLNYALSFSNHTVGDLHECIFAHKYICEIGHNLKDNNIVIIDDEFGVACYLYRMSALLAPTLCFYSLSVNEERRRLNNNKVIDMDLSKYIKYMGYSLDSTGVLIITDPSAFLDDLKAQIPSAIMQSEEKLSCEFYKYGFIEDFPIRFGKVDYNKHNYFDFFFDATPTMDELFWKSKQYEPQSEVRFVIPNIGFRQKFSFVGYNYKRNIINVQLPNLPDYSRFFRGDEVSNIRFEVQQDGMCKVLYVNENT